MNKVILLAALTFCFVYPTFAQNKRKYEEVPKNVAEADMEILDGTSIKLASLSGKVVVLVVWASWCPPCRIAVNDLNTIHKEFAPRGVEVIGLSTENREANTDKLREFVRAYEIDYKIGWLNEEITKSWLSEERVIPQIFVITGEGVIAKRFLGYTPQHSLAPMRKAIEQSLENPDAKR